KPSDCLHLFKNYLRLRAPSVTLDTLAADSNAVRSFLTTLDTFRFSKSVEAEHQYKQHLRSYAATYARAIREYVKGLLQIDDAGSDSLRDFTTVTKKALDVFRSKKDVMDELDTKFANNCSKFCDEYMSEVTLSEIQKIIARLKPGNRRDSLIAFWNEENTYRKTYHPESCAQGEDHAAKDLYRFRLLSKYIESYLFLNIRAHTGPTFLVHSLYGLAAALSMVFATIVAFVWQGQYGSLSYNLFIALVIAYIFKDRIKALLQVQLSEKFKKWIPDRRLEIFRNDIHRVGKCRESFSFFDVRNLPESIRNLRANAQSVKGIYNWRFENILLYKKEMFIHTDPQLFADARYAILDSTWFNVAPLFDFIDANRDQLPVSENAVDPPAFAEKYYHIYLIRSVTVFNDKHKKVSTRDEVTRIAIDHEGIRGLETLNAI
ncbi:MAG TPA: hypothetical protein DCW60_00715, partial [Sutterella sp.]|nr:hypothetical protein [Sutterella sp.]